MEIIPLLLLILVCCALLFGYPVAFTLSGVSILFALICIPLGIFDESILKSIPLRIFGIMNNVTLLASKVTLFMMPNILKGMLFKIDSSNIPSGIQIRANKIETPERVNATG